MQENQDSLSDKEVVQPSLFCALRTNRPPRQTSLAEIHRLIVSDSGLDDNTKKYRYYAANGFEKDADKVKRQQCPAFSVAAAFSEKRQMSRLTGWTGLSLCDYDGITPEQLLRALELLKTDPYWVLVYITISGRGLRIIFRTEGVTDKARYAQAYRQGNEHYSRLLGFEYDGQVKDVTRLSCLCHDANALLRPDAEAFPTDYAARQENTDRKPGRKRTVGIDKAVPYALDLAEQRGLKYEAGHRNEYISQVCYQLNRYGVDESDCLQWALTHFSDYGAEQVAPIVRSCYQNTEEHATQHLPAGRNSRKTETASVDEIEDFLLLQASFRQNIISSKCEVLFNEEVQEQEFRPLTDRDVNTFWSRINKTGKYSRREDIYTILHSEFVPLFNPFQSYLDHLPAWDGKTDHIGRLAATVHVKGDQEIFVRYFRKWLVAMLPTLIEKTTVNHEILVFIGEQGVYKTTWFNRLLPPPLQAYFYTKINSAHFTKDDQLTLSEFALVCYEEIDDMRPSELNQLKAMITTHNINERAAYAHFKESRVHTASFCGTGNNIQFLSDPTGNRRWLAFEIEMIDNPYTTPTDYDGVYSQALALWKSGFQYWFDLEEIQELNGHNAHFEIPNLEQELILTYYRRPLPDEMCTFVTTANILERINAAVRQPLSSVKIGIIMKKLGFETARTNNMRGYRVIARTMDEIRISGQSIARDTGQAAKPEDQPSSKSPTLPF